MDPTAPAPSGDPRDLLASARSRLRTGDVQGAVPELERAHDAAIAAHARALEADVLLELARALAAQGTLDQAHLCLERVREVSREAALPGHDGEALLEEARLLLPQGDAARARARLQEATRRFDEATAASRASGDAAAALAWTDRARAARDLLAGPALAAAPLGPAERAIAAAHERRDEARRQRATAIVEMLFETSRTLVEERDPDRVLLRVLDAAVLVTGAERGFVLRAPRPDDADLEVKAARNFDRRDVSRPEWKVSRTVIDRALDRHEPVLVRDAGEDRELSERTSVSRHRLRSIVCVPIESEREGGFRGVLYLDNRFGAAAFDPGDLAALRAFAAHAAVAVESAQSQRTLAEQNRALAAARTRAEELARRLEGELARTGSELGEVRAQLDATRSRLAERSSLGEIVGASSPMQLLYGLLDKVKDQAAPVLIQGESGTGKELIARAIHFESRRRAHPFVGENCAAIPDSLVESTLFGHEPGAFTGATARRIGLFELAGEGTIFLDEVGDLSPPHQAKILRVLQEKTLRRVGGTAEVPVSPRVVCATHRDLPQMVREGRFREDLYYRLGVLVVKVPPLRERRDDIPLLISRLAAKESFREPRFAPEALRALLDHAWPGNVRELANELRRLAALGAERVELADLSPTVRERGASARPAGQGLGDRPLTWKEGERRLLLMALAAARGDRARAADILALPHGTLWNKLKKHGIGDADVFSS